jgi:uncharacterized protein YqcC (DUF446 family)
MDNEKLIPEKVEEVLCELKEQGLLKVIPPAWVNHFQPGEMRVDEFIDWLQFIFLPNCIYHCGSRIIIPSNNVALQAKDFFGNDPERHKLLQLLIELDSLM